MRRILAAILVPLFSGLIFLPAIAQKQDQSQGQEPIRVGVPIVLLEVTVKDRSGQVMEGLKKEDFTVKEDGVEQKVEIFGRDQLPLAVALVVDTSASIRPFFQELHTAAVTALGALKPEDSVALFTFSSQVEQRTALTKDKASVAAQLEKLTAGGSTNINGAMAESATELVREAPDGRRVIILVSDDVPTDNGGMGVQEVTDRVLASGAAVYNLKVPGDNPISDRVIAKTIRGLISVPKLVEQTGGEIFELQKEESLDKAFGDLIQRIKTRYTLGYYATRTNTNQLYHKLDIGLAPSFGRRGQNYVILSRSGYYGAPSAQ